MLGTFKIDRSNFGHALEAFIIAIVITAVCVLIGIYSPREGFLLGSALALAWYIGREKRDCETGLDLPSGSPKAWLLMWIRWKNLLDLVGPILVHAVAWGHLPRPVPLNLGRNRREDEGGGYREREKRQRQPRHQSYLLRAVCAGRVPFIDHR